MNVYDKSEARYQEASRYLAGGVSSSLRSAMKPLPIFAESAQGAYIRDVDGNSYIDYLLAYGPLILGHVHPVLTERIHQAMQQGYTYGLQHDGEIQLARRLTELVPCAEQVAFSGSGTEAVMLALRIARAYTGKTKVVRFHGHYHGWSDSIFTSFPSPDIQSKDGGSADGHLVEPGTGGQSLNSLEDIILLPWNDLDALRHTLTEHGREIAAVITEPVMCNSGCIRPKPGYLEQMRQWTAEENVVLIFDEVITGFRLGLGGAHGRFGILPDLVTMGKAMAGGIALSAVAGSSELMRIVADGRVNHLGTLNGNCVSTSAALAVLELLSEDGGAPFGKMESVASALADGLRGLLKKHGVRGVVNQIGPVFHMMFIDREQVCDFETFNQRDSRKYAAFAERLLHEGVLVRPSGLWYVSAAHSEREVEQTLEAVDRTLISLQ